MQATLEVIQDSTNMPVTLWKDTERDKKRDNAQELIDLLLGARNSGGGWPINLETTIAFAELASSASSALGQSLIMQVLNQMNDKQMKTVGDFEAIYEQIITSKSAPSSPADIWKFFIPVRLTLSSDLKRPVKITMLGKTFSFLPKVAIERQLDKRTREALRNPNLISVLTDTKIEQTPEIFLCVTGHSNRLASAWKNIEPAFNALRGLIELSLGLGGWRISSSGKSPRRKIPHPLWMIAQKSSGEVEWIDFITDEGDSSRTFELTAHQFAVIKKKAEALKKEPDASSTLSIIADCLRLYAQAMDARFRHECFLGLWQLAEAITRSESIRGNTNAVINRIAWHGKRAGLKGSGYKETLKVLGDKRNDIVHRGIHDIEDEDINILKFVCEIALIWLFQARKALPTVAHLEQFYRLRDINSTELEAMKDCIAYMSAQRVK